MRAGAGGPAEALASVVTSVLDPVTGNNTDTESTLVTVPGGTDTTISAPGGSEASLTWTDGDAEAGYVVWRHANGVTTRFPAAGMLPATASSFSDSSPVIGTVNCYRVVAYAAENEETPIAASQWLCQLPNSASPPDALGDFRLRFVDADDVRLDWSSFTGHTGYVVQGPTAPGGYQGRPLYFHAMLSL